MASLFAYPLLLFVMDYKLGRIYAKTNAALVDRRGLEIKSLLLFPVPNHAQIHAQIQSIQPGIAAVGWPRTVLIKYCIYHYIIFNPSQKWAISSCLV